MRADRAELLIWTPWGAAADAAKDAAQNFFDSLMTAVYGMMVDLLTGTFRLLNTHSVVADLLGGSVGSVTEVTMYVAVTIAGVLTIVQIGRGVIRPDGGFGRLLGGIPEYFAACSIGVWVVIRLDGAGTQIGNRILEAGGITNGWLGVGDRVKSWAEVGDEASAVLLGVLGLTMLLPAALLYAAGWLAKQVVLPVGACLLPIMAAGRLSEFGRAWLPGLARVLGAASLGPGGSALLLVIGFTFMNAGDGENQAVRMFIGSIVLVASPLAPLGIYRMLAFVDPATPSGAATRELVERAFTGGSGRSGTGAGGQAGRSTVDAAEAVAEARFAAGLAAIAAGSAGRDGTAGGRPLARAAHGDDPPMPHTLDPGSAEPGGTGAALPAGSRRSLPAAAPHDAPVGRDELAGAGPGAASGPAERPDAGSAARGAYVPAHRVAPPAVPPAEVVFDAGDVRS
ncbi:hypothetical protein KZZ52_27685 [Dactylosporangium sp. AC04546]|uniref:hypothetical protein n=1 Tax=Dactylosporangium sp. AC04546 TaxID=2862460 RepID=UPI001EDFF003|nr:hypothetical protein [Dactylosporangium sp. AC04546]WVK89049.1 hypothetical protein KZZ52_27685 [Dactylosporangium sp. AC04546]